MSDTVKIDNLANNVFEEIDNPEVEAETRNQYYELVKECGDKHEKTLQRWVDDNNDLRRNTSTETHIQSMLVFRNYDRVLEDNYDDVVKEVSEHINREYKSTSVMNVNMIAVGLARLKRDLENSEKQDESKNSFYLSIFEDAITLLKKHSNPNHTNKNKNIQEIIDLRENAKLLAAENVGGYVQ